jgi:hypothetical protein
VLVIAFHIIEIVLLLAISIQTLKQNRNLMKIRIEDTTLEALVTLAESAVAADAHDKADLAALQATVANETDLPDALKTRIDALVTPPAPAP